MRLGAFGESLSDATRGRMGNAAALRENAAENALKAIAAVAKLSRSAIKTLDPPPAAGSAALAACQRGDFQVCLAEGQGVIFSAGPQHYRGPRI